MEPDHESNEVYEVEVDVMDDRMNDGVPDTADQSDFGYYAEETDERSAEVDYVAETDEFTVMDTQTGDIIAMDGEVCSMDMEAVDVGCKDSPPLDSPPLPDKAARGLQEEAPILKAKDQDEFLKKAPEKLKLPGDGTWHQGSANDHAVEEKAPPIPIKKGNTKSRIDMFEAM